MNEFKLKEGVANRLHEQVIEEENPSYEAITTPYRPSDIRIDTHPMNLGDLIEMIDAGWINFDTEYQRLQNLWSQDKQSRLIESAILGLRLPTFYFEEVSRRQWNIIDGLQRCCAIRNFCVDKSLVLSGLEFLGDSFNGKKYDQFPFEVRRDLRMLPITVNILQSGTPPDVKYILFKRLNTGGVTLKPQEIRTSMFPDVVPILREMAESQEFIRVTEGRIPKDRQEDKDFVSRFIAFYLLGSKSYRVGIDLDTFINESMLKLQKMIQERKGVDEMVSSFAHALEVSENIFGNDAFRKRFNRQASRNPINKAYFEVLTTIFAKLSKVDESHLIEKKELLKDNLIALMKKPAFVTSISTGTGMFDRVQTRFKGVAEAVQATLENREIGGE